MKESNDENDEDAPHPPSQLQPMENVQLHLMKPARETEVSQLQPMENVQLHLMKSTEHEEMEVIPLHSQAQIPHLMESARVTEDSHTPPEVDVQHSAMKLEPVAETQHSARKSTPQGIQFIFFPILKHVRKE